MNSAIYVIVVIFGAIVDGQQNKDPDETNRLDNSDLRNGDRSIHYRGIRELPNCDTAILSCCADSTHKQKHCFNTVECGHVYNNGAACNPKTILNVLEKFKNAYAPNTNTTKNRVKRWQYTSEQPPTRHQEESYLNRNEQEYLPRIVSLLEEIRTYVKKPHQAVIPHRIYFPYTPVPYTVPETYFDTNNFKVPDIRNRGAVLDDNLTISTNENDVNDGARPISFVPIKPEQPLKRIPPKVEHGSKQYDAGPLSSQTSSSESNASLSKVENPCISAVLACCVDDKKQQRNCFYNFGCGVPYDNGNACKSDSIKAAFDSYKPK